VNARLCYVTIVRRDDSSAFSWHRPGLPRIRWTTPSRSLC